MTGFQKTLVGFGEDPGKEKSLAQRICRFQCSRISVYVGWAARDCTPFVLGVVQEHARPLPLLSKALPSDRRRVPVQCVQLARTPQLTFLSI